MNVLVKTFATRDEALDFRIKDASKFGRALDDYEILDDSDL